MALKEILKQKIEEHRPRTARLVKEFGKVKIDEVTIDQCIGGARDVRCLVTDISYLDPQEGIRFRGKNIPETFEALPKAPGSAYPTVESFWFSCLPARFQQRHRWLKLPLSGRSVRLFHSMCLTQSVPCPVKAIRW